MIVPQSIVQPIVNASMHEKVLNWIAAHPYQTAFHVVNGVIMCTPAAVTVPFFNLLGFSAAGPAAGSAASGIMGYFGFVPAGGIYATVQSAAMGGIWGERCGGRGTGWGCGVFVGCVAFRSSTLRISYRWARME